MARLLLVVCATLVSASARAEPGRWTLPASKTGFVSVGGGVRLVPQGPFLTSAAQAGKPGATASGVQPSAGLTLAYRVDRTWSVAVDAGWSRDGYAFTDGSTLGLSTVAVTLGATYAFDLGLGWFEPFAGLGTGYWLSSAATHGWASDKGVPLKDAEQEAHTTGFYGALGVRAALSDAFGLVLEDRYALAAAGLGSLGAASVGGNTVSVMFYGIWHE